MLAISIGALAGVVFFSYSRSKTVPSEPITATSGSAAEMPEGAQVVEYVGVAGLKGWMEKNIGAVHIEALASDNTGTYGSTMGYWVVYTPKEKIDQKQ